jgi:hypothetical protein
MIRRRFLQMLGFAPVVAPMAAAAATETATHLGFAGGEFIGPGVPTHVFGEAASDYVMPRDTVERMSAKGMTFDNVGIKPQELSEIARISGMEGPAGCGYDAAMPDEDRKLTVIDGDRPADRPRAGRRRDIAEDEQVTCWRCLADIKVETSAVVPVTLAPRRTPDGRKTGGTKIWACAHCLARGVVTELIGS